MYVYYFVHLWSGAPNTISKTEQILVVFKYMEKKPLQFKRMLLIILHGIYFAVP